MCSPRPEGQQQQQQPKMVRQWTAAEIRAAKAEKRSRRMSSTSALARKISDDPSSLPQVDVGIELGQMKVMESESSTDEEDESVNSDNEEWNQEQSNKFEQQHELQLRRQEMAGVASDVQKRSRFFEALCGCFLRTNVGADNVPDVDVAVHGLGSRFPSSTSPVFDHPPNQTRVTPSSCRSFEVECSPSQLELSVREKEIITFNTVGDPDWPTSMVRPRASPCQDGHVVFGNPVNDETTITPRTE